MEKGTVYFFTGLSGAGKTTIGGLFYRRLKAVKPNIILMDGDQVRPVLFEDIGYTDAERLRGTRRAFRLYRFLAGQGIDVVSCAISMYSEIRDWNRANIENYREIYIKAAKDTLYRRDQKGLYTSHQENMVGLDLPFDEPKHPDLVVENDGNETPEVIVNRIIAALGLDLRKEREETWN